MSPLFGGIILTILGNFIGYLGARDICHPKSKGDLGCRDFSLFNQALIAYQCWKIITQLDSIVGKFFKSMYFHNSTLQEVRPPSRATVLWKSLLGGKIIRSRAGLEDW